MQKSVLAVIASIVLSGTSGCESANAAEADVVVPPAAIVQSARADRCGHASENVNYWRNRVALDGSDLAGLERESGRLFDKHAELVRCHQRACIRRERALASMLDTIRLRIANVTKDQANHAERLQQAISDSATCE